MQCPAIAAMKSLGAAAIASTAPCACTRKWAKPAGVAPCRVEMSAPLQKNFGLALLTTTTALPGRLRRARRRREVPRPSPSRRRWPGPVQDDGADAGLHGKVDRHRAVLRKRRFARLSGTVRPSHDLGHRLGDVLLAQLLVGVLLDAPLHVDRRVLRGRTPNMSSAAGHHLASRSCAAALPSGVAQISRRWRKPDFVWNSSSASSCGDTFASGS